MANKLIDIRKTTKGLYYVIVYFGGFGDDLFETATHYCRFESKLDAERLAQRIDKAVPAGSLNGPIDAIDRAYWQGPTSKAAMCQWDAKFPPTFVPTINF